jgi:hypothetical protein
VEYPKTDDPLVRALQRLLVTHGGHVAVAERAGVNDQSLYQIATLRLHSTTKRPKSVGPKIRRRLDAAFPGWLDQELAAAAVVANEPPSRYAVVPLRPAIRVVLGAIARLTLEQWQMVRVRIDAVPQRADQIEGAAQDIERMLEARSGSPASEPHVADGANAHAKNRSRKDQAAA